MKRTLLLAGLLLALSLHPALAQEERWCLVTDTGVSIAMNQVTCLAAADDETTFSVVLTDGSAIAGISTARFEQRIPTPIKAVKDETIHVGRDLSLEGLAPDTPVRVYDTTGKLRQKGTANLISLTSLPAGIYIIQVNNTSFKIRKQ